MTVNLEELNKSSLFSVKFMPDAFYVTMQLLQNRKENIYEMVIFNVFIYLFLQDTPM